MILQFSGAFDEAALARLAEVLDASARWAYAGSEEEDDGLVAYGWVDRDDAVVELVDGTACGDGAQISISAPDAAEVAAVLVSALPGWERMDAERGAGD